MKMEGGLPVVSFDEEEFSRSASSTSSSTSTSSDSESSASRNGREKRREMSIPALSLGFNRVARRRASLSGEALPILVRRTVEQPKPEVPSEARKRQSQVGGWGPVPGLASFMLTPQDREEHEEEPPKMPKLPKGLGIKLRNRIWKAPVPTLKRFHLRVAAKLGLDADAGDWDPGQTYLMSVEKLEELAEQKLQRQRYKAAVMVQARWRSLRIRRVYRQVIIKRLESRQRLREWFRKLLRRRRVADKIQHLRSCIVSTVKIQAHVRRWLVQKHWGADLALHRVQYRMTMLQEQLYPFEERERDREEAERSFMSREEVLSQQAEAARKQHEADIQRSVQVLQPAVRRWLSHLKYWRALQEREKELKEEQAKRRRYRIHRDEDEEQVKKAGSGDEPHRMGGRTSGVKEDEKGWHASPLSKALLALEAMTTTVESEKGRSSSHSRGFRARAYGKTSIVLPPAPPGFRSDIAGARGGPRRRHTPRLVSVPSPLRHDRSTSRSRSLPA